jgi:hypothetical protein
MFANGDAPTEKGKVKPEYVRMYYEHQYDRMAKLEDQAMTITNVVVTLTVVVLTFGLGSTISPAATVALSLVMVLANGFAIFYTVRTGSWIQTHRLRAKRTLKEFAPALYNLDNTTFAPHRTGVMGMGRRKIQIILHILLGIACAFIPFLR